MRRCAFRGSGAYYNHLTEMGNHRDGSDQQDRDCPMSSGPDQDGRELGPPEPAF